METAPVKSKPLHNFSLPQLKWAHKNSSSNSTSQHHRFRGRDSPDHHHLQSHRQSDPDSNSETQPAKPKPEPVPTVSKTPPRNDVVCAEEENNWEGKPWNLRPRKEVKEVAVANKETTVENSRNNITTGVIKSQRLRGLAEGGHQNGGLGSGFGVERKEKKRIWISLSKEEIEEDIYSLTGSKPARRPKKRSKNVQKQLDTLFPGLYLVGLTADAYRVNEVPK